MLSVCSTAPMAGMARYASRWPWLFQQKVPTRSPGSMPSRVRAAASFSARMATSAKVAVRLPALLDGDDGAVAVDPLPVAQDVSDQERGVLHGAFHAPSMTNAPFPCSGWWRNDPSQPWTPPLSCRPLFRSAIDGGRDRRRAVGGPGRRRDGDGRPGLGRAAAGVGGGPTAASPTATAQIPPAMLTLYEAAAASVPGCPVRGAQRRQGGGSRGADAVRGGTFARRHISPPPLTRTVPRSVGLNCPGPGWLGQGCVTAAA